MDAKLVSALLLNSRIGFAGRSTLPMLFPNEHSVHDGSDILVSRMGTTVEL